MKKVLKKIIINVPYFLLGFLVDGAKEFVIVALIIIASFVVDMLIEVFL